MRIIVCIKQVPVISAMEFDAQSRTLKREGVPSEVSSFDVRALLRAVEIRNRHGGEVIVLTMGPPQARAALEDCLALGADRGVHLCDRAFAGSDTLATAQALALAARRESFDLILCGRNSTDAETGQVGPELAELLDLPQITGARTLEVDPAARTATAEREIDGAFETVVAPLPLLVTAAEDLAPERFPSKAEREAAKQKPIVELRAADLHRHTLLFGARGSPTVVAGLKTLEQKRLGRILEAETPAAGVEALVQELMAYGLFGRWREPEGAKDEAARTPVARIGSRDVLVLVEVMGGALRRVSLELLHKAEELAQSVGGSVWALLIGDGVAVHIRELAAHGALRVFLADDPAWRRPSTDAYVRLLVSVMTQYQPGIVLLPATVLGRDVAPRVAARLRLGLTGDCIDLSLDRGGRLLQHKPAFGGAVVAPIWSQTRPEMATVRPGMLPLGKGDRRGAPAVVPLPVDREPSPVRVVAERWEAEAAAELDHSEVVVGVGMGIGGKEHLPVVQALADVLGGALCATRDVTDKGWLPKQYQVGLTGRAIAPRLYIAVGIRGAFEHVVGVRRAGLIVAINTKPKAPIFKHADLGIAGDYAVYVPLLTERLRQVRGATRG
jgi:electron transfer flavoprotein alpha subunit